MISNKHKALHAEIDKEQILHPETFDFMDKQGMATKQTVSRRLNFDNLRLKGAIAMCKVVSTDYGRMADEIAGMVEHEDDPNVKIQLRNLAHYIGMLAQSFEANSQQLSMTVEWHKDLSQKVVASIKTNGKRKYRSRFRKKATKKMDNITFDRQFNKTTGQELS